MREDQRILLQGIGNILGKLATRGVAEKLAGTIQGQQAFLDKVAERMLTSESPMASWTTVPEETRDLWRRRAAAAVQGIVELIPKPAFKIPGMR